MIVSKIDPILTQIDSVPMKRCFTGLGKGAKAVMHISLSELGEDIIFK